MEFHKKLQELRKQKGLTQEELAGVLSVSRTAISKWESGRGYPNIDSLKAIAKYFSVTIDQLLSSDELLAIAEEDTKQTKNNTYNLIFGLLDISVLAFLFLPLFADRIGDDIREVSLLFLTNIAPYLTISYFVVVFGMMALGIVILATPNNGQADFSKNIQMFSILINALGILLMIISLQPYAATFLFIFLIIKVLMLLKQR
ncbi:MAG: helix-turn-helix domain-containing protein [Oscillospiraceae bacterium]|nr:helix-turn-helix domain-containing protein [Oscillospiraceae bacterium]